MYIKLKGITFIQKGKIIQYRRLTPIQQYSNIRVKDFVPILLGRACQDNHRASS